MKVNAYGEEFILPDVMILGLDDHMQIRNDEPVEPGRQRNIWDAVPIGEIT